MDMKAIVIAGVLTIIACLVGAIAIVATKKPSKPVSNVKVSDEEKPSIIHAPMVAPIEKRVEVIPEKVSNDLQDSVNAFKELIAKYPAKEHEKNEAVLIFLSTDQEQWAKSDFTCRNVFCTGLAMAKFPDKDFTFHLAAGIIYSQSIVDAYGMLGERGTDTAPVYIFDAIHAVHSRDIDKFNERVRLVSVNLVKASAEIAAKEDGRIIEVERLRLVPVRDHYEFDLRITNKSLYTPLTIELTMEFKNRENEYVGTENHIESNMNPGEERIARVVVFDMPAIGDYVISGRVLNSDQHFVFEIKDDKKNHPIPGAERRRWVESEMQKLKNE